MALDPGNLDQVFFSESREFLTKAELILELPVTSIALEELTELHRCAHSIKGTALMIGFDGLGHVASALASYISRLKEANPVVVAQCLSLVTEAFNRCSSLLEQLAEGASRATSDDEIVARLSTPLHAQASIGFKVIFSLSPLAQLSHVLVDDMLEELRFLTGQNDLMMLDEDEMDQCSFTLSEHVDIERVRMLLEGVADPGSVRVESLTSAHARRGSESIREDAQPPEPKTVDRISRGLGSSGDTTGDGLACGSTLRCLTVLVAGRCFAVRVSEVDSVAAVRAVQPYPVRDPAVLGMIEHDGSYLRVFDFKACLGLGVSDTQPGMQLITKLDNERVGVQVDRVDDLVEFDERSLQQIAGLKMLGFDGVFRYRNGLFWLAALPPLLSRATQGKSAELALASATTASREATQPADDDSFNPLVQSYSCVTDELLGLRAFVLNLALLEAEVGSSIPVALLSQGLTTMRRLSRTVGDLGCEIERQIDNDLTVQSLRVRQNSFRSPAANPDMDHRNSKESGRLFVERVEVSPPPSPPDVGRPLELQTDTSHASRKLTRGEKQQVRRSRSSTAPLPPVGRAHNPLEDQWFD